MIKKPKLIDWMICDDIRQEFNNKLIFIGVYGGDVIVGSIPAILPQLVFFSKWDTTNAPIKKFEFTIFQPNGKEVGPISSEPPHSEPKSRAFIQIAIAPFNIEVPGEYKIKAKINGINCNIGSFNVLLKTPTPAN